MMDICWIPGIIQILGVHLYGFWLTTLLKEDKASALYDVIFYKTRTVLDEMEKNLKVVPAARDSLYLLCDLWASLQSDSLVIIITFKAWDDSIQLYKDKKN